MSELEEKLGSILSNPQMMQQIMSMAQAMGQSQSEEAQFSDVSAQPETPQIPQIDPGMLQMLTGFAQQNSVDQNQQTLLHALSPYLSHNRVEKLERAMRAAKMASLASTFLNSGGLQSLIGR